MYDLNLVEPGPLPPHERTWRHPSELGPTKVDVETGSNFRVAALLTGTLAIVVVAAMIVAVTPRGSSSPVAVSATTTPRTRPTITRGAPAAPVAAISRTQTAKLVTLVAMPNVIASTPQVSLDGRSIAQLLPLPTEQVLVRTNAVTYQLRWGDVPLLGPPDGSVVINTNGDLVAHVSRGRLILLAVD